MEMISIKFHKVQLFTLPKGEVLKIDKNKGAPFRARHTCVFVSVLYYWMRKGLLVAEEMICMLNLQGRKRK